VFVTAFAVLFIAAGVAPLVLRSTSAALPESSARAVVAAPTEIGPTATQPARNEETPVAVASIASPDSAIAGLDAPRDLSMDKGDIELNLPHTPPTAVPTTPALPTLDPALTQELQHLLDDTVADGFVPGAVLSVSMPGYAPWTGASGLANRAQGRAMEPDTPIRVASVSKMFTAVVVLQLVEEGTLTLDTPIETWLPGVVPNADVITVRQLLQHTSGLYDYLEDRNFVGQTQREPERVWAPQELVTYATRFPSRAIGRWDYSSTNYVILGMLVEQVTQRPLAQEMRQRIFAPLELRNTVFLPQESVSGTLARGYTRGTDITNASMSFAFATANIATTAEDLQQFGRALFSGGLLKPETRDLMFQFVSGRGQYDMPALEYGLGIMRNRLPIGNGPGGQARPARSNLVLGHIGGYGGFRAALWYAPDSEVVIAISLNQAQTDPNILATAVLDQVLRSTGR
jgi:D-alanyl-D-alanine carboxypeptidase